MGPFLRHRKNEPRLRLAQALGAFPIPGEGNISPLYVFFEIVNEGHTDAEVSRLYLTPKGGRRPAYDGPFGGDRDLPCTLKPGEVVRFWVRAKTLARALKHAGCYGRPRVRFVVEDGAGNRHEKGFGFRVDEYLALKDE